LLVNPNNANAEPQTKDMEEAAAKLGAELVVWRASSEDGFDSAFATQRQRVDALVVSADPFFISHRDRLVMLAARHSIPAIYYGRDFAVAGGLMSYGTNFSDAFRHAGYVSRILMGEKPSDLPVMLSDKFHVNSPPRRIRGWFHLRTSPRAGRLQRGKNGLGGPPVVFWSPSLPRGAS
jgi:putative ABC transport system substrate-binding protein